MTGFTADSIKKMFESMIKSSTYVCLLKSEPSAGGGVSGAEPSSSAGYKRAKFGEVNTGISYHVKNAETIFFEESINGEYGTITHVGLSDSEEIGGAVFFAGKLNKAEDVGQNKVPIFRAGALDISIDKKTSGDTSL